MDASQNLLSAKIQQDLSIQRSQSDELNRKNVKIQHGIIFDSEIRLKKEHQESNDYNDNQDDENNSNDQVHEEIRKPIDPKIFESDDEQDEQAQEKPNNKINNQKAKLQQDEEEEEEEEEQEDQQISDNIFKIQSEEQEDIAQEESGDDQKEYENCYNTIYGLYNMAKTRGQKWRLKLINCIVNYNGNQVIVANLDAELKWG